MKLLLDYHKSVKSRIPVGRLRQTIRDFLVSQNVSGTVYLELQIVGPQKMQSLNRRHRNQYKPTDVLSFPVGEKSEILNSKPMVSQFGGAHGLNLSNPFQILPLGSIVLCPEVARTTWQRGTYGDIAQKDVYLFLVVHGLMHLLGYDHETDDEFNRWEQIVTQFQSRHSRH